MREEKFSKYRTATSCKTEENYNRKLKLAAWAVRQLLRSVRKSDSTGCFQTWNAVALRCKLLCKWKYFGWNKITAHEIIHAVDLLSSKHQPGGENLIPSSEHLIPSSEHLIPSSEHLIPSSEHLIPSSEHLIPSSEHLIPSSEHLIPSSEHLIPSSEHLVSQMSSSYCHVFGHIQCAMPPYYCHSSISYRELFPLHFKLFRYAERPNAFATRCSSWFEFKGTANRYYLASRWRRVAESVWLYIEREIWMHNCRKA